LQKLSEPLKKCEIGALIVSPTRELATQISQVLQEFLDDLNLKQMLMIGGHSMAKDLKKFKCDGANVIVCTPGRLEDILTGGKGASAVADMGEGAEAVKKGLKALEVLILDEADRMLSQGFERSLNAILACLPKQRRTGLFSATQTRVRV